MRQALVAAGRVVALMTTGRSSGRPTLATVGFVQEPDGSLIVAARDDAAHWARNLAVDPRVTATWGERHAALCAELLHGEEHARAVRDLILRYGTPSERLGRGPAFRLRPCGPASATPPRGGASTDTVTSSTE